ncbi:Energy-coupling factor transporter transmembrane protein EcfT [Candidatus Norongarragalina meridionalis]|nr:Energy-coupling factor transporter transmembrane protein EcfT [Candidatus Norongarragalina meridionalis]
MHGVNALAKLAAALLVSLAAFATTNLFVLALVILAEILAFSASYEPLTRALRPGKWFFLLAVFLVTLQVLFWPYGMWAGFANGCIIVLRLLALLYASKIVLLTTMPSDIAHSMRAARVPSQIAFVTSMALRLIPLLDYDFTETKQAFDARTRQVSAKGHLFGLKLVSAFIAASLERAETLALSLEARGFSIKRRKSPKIAFFARDWAVFGVSAVILAVSLAFP